MYHPFADQFYVFPHACLYSHIVELPKLVAAKNKLQQKPSDWMNFFLVEFILSLYTFLIKNTLSYCPVPTVSVWLIAVQWNYLEPTQIASILNV